MLKRLRVQGFKSLRDVEIHFSPLTVLFGANAAGKSNLLDALHLLARIGRTATTTDSLNEAFKPPYRGSPVEVLSAPPGCMATLRQQAHAAFSLEADITLSDRVVDAVGEDAAMMNGGAGSQSPTIWQRDLRYRIELDIVIETGQIRVTDEYLAALTPDGVPAPGTPFIRRGRSDILMNAEEQEREMRQVVNAGAYELLREDTGRTVPIARGLSRSVLSWAVDPSVNPHAVAVKKELSRWAFVHLEPREKMREAGPPREVFRLGLMGENLPELLNTIKHANPGQFEGIKKALQMLAPEVSDIGVSTREDGVLYLDVREGAASVPTALLSDGTLRAIGLLAIVSSPEPPCLLGLEEPENGIHPSRLRLIAEYLNTRALLGDVQVIATTHSPYLVELIRPEYSMVCRKEHGETMIRPLIDWPGVTAADILDEDAPTISEQILRGDFNA